MPGASEFPADPVASVPSLAYQQANTSAGASAKSGVQADPEAVQLVVSELVTNAARHTPDWNGTRIFGKTDCGSGE
ncbi:hypothetical protein ABT127_18635 [Streptomyces sp. NPDC001904]|uniref:hypothetical protein n=1 Tax=Streptomyces sp. NPDC001904 TaxID=3154531 RepID=UPI00332902ED